jgi:MurNAc alpha-1-phosphate uridylyltransferase
MEAMILAAGRGERMRPITDSVPKPLIDIGGVTLIEHHLFKLSGLGFKHVVINVSYLGEKITGFIGDGARFNLKISYSNESDGALGTAGGIVNALELFSEDQFLVVNGDIFTNFNFSRMQLNRFTRAHLVLVPNPPHHPKGDFCLKGESVCIPTPESRNTYTFAGIGMYRRAFFDSLPPGIFELGQHFRNSMRDEKITGTVHESLWIDVGNPQRLQQARTVVEENSQHNIV